MTIYYGLKELNQNEYSEPKLNDGKLSSSIIRRVSDCENGPQRIEKAGVCEIRIKCIKAIECDWYVVS